MNVYHVMNQGKLLFVSQNKEFFYLHNLVLAAFFKQNRLISCYTTIFRAATTTGISTIYRIESEEIGEKQSLYLCFRVGPK